MGKMGSHGEAEQGAHAHKVAKPVRWRATSRERAGFRGRFWVVALER